MADITIGRLSFATGVKIETIRYYEKIGIMPDPPRTAGKQRIYDPSHIARLNFIKRSRDLGFGLDAVRSMLGLNDETPSCAEVYALTTAHLSEVRKKIADLKRLERSLSEITKECVRGDTPDCPIIDTLSS
ncbi:MAG: helix-turn-helix domain-containing protein [Alphaproteobacteria bacterium]|nr:helix-turn-helix domain-containing protein [Alphaproteobacteria bacterium]